MCTAFTLSACGNVDYGLKNTNHKIIKDRVICRGDKYPTGFHAGHVDRATLEVLKMKCDIQKGYGSFPIEIIISHTPTFNRSNTVTIIMTRRAHCSIRSTASSVPQPGIIR